MRMLNKISWYFYFLYFLLISVLQAPLLPLRPLPLHPQHPLLPWALPSFVLPPKEQQRLYAEVAAESRHLKLARDALNKRKII